MEQLKLVKKINLINKAELGKKATYQEIKFTKLKLDKKKEDNALEIKMTELSNKEDKKDKNCKLQMKKLKNENKIEERKINLKLEKIKMAHEENLSKMNQEKEKKNLKSIIGRQKAEQDNKQQEIEPEIYIKELEMKNKQLGKIESKTKLKKPEIKNDFQIIEENRDKNNVQFGKKGKIIVEIELIKIFLESSLLERMNPNQNNMIGNNINQNQASQLFNHSWRNFSSTSGEAPLLR